MYGSAPFSLVLAGGSSTRMSCKKHKVLHSIGNLELINHVLFLISDIGTEDNIIVCSDFFDFENRSFVKNFKIRKVNHPAKLKGILIN